MFRKIAKISAGLFQTVQMEPHMEIQTQNAVFILLTSFSCSFSQDSIRSKWSLIVDFSIQEHDKRLYFAPQRASYLARHPEFWGTYQLSVKAEKVFK